MERERADQELPLVVVGVDVRPALTSLEKPLTPSWPPLAARSRLKGNELSEMKMVPGGAAHMEPVSGQAVMLAHEVEVSAVAALSPTPG